MITTMKKIYIVPNTEMIELVNDSLPNLRWVNRNEWPP